MEEIQYTLSSIGQRQLDVAILLETIVSGVDSNCTVYFVLSNLEKEPLELVVSVFAGPYPGNVDWGGPNGEGAGGDAPPE
ncbi:hypothetical protein DPMN_030612 [Dreissena polymorpha]|uniref:Uncharacterized protein n=1 Tax=Dreissena polymorpha TaxID=45954 RepID=A0A9D4M0P8_DREPO|nr:hypothetical protein DPMN_030612 [Dreissena polymorpha]